MFDGQSIELLTTNCEPNVDVFWLVACATHRVITGNWMITFGQDKDNYRRDENDVMTLPIITRTIWP
ncbi:hypothetical protein ACNKHT_13645 [Shigella flexneri]